MNNNSKIVIKCSENFSSLRIEDPRKSPSVENTVVNTQLFMTQNIPELSKHFILEGKIGEGTFSKVYRARLIKNRDKQYALKYVIPTIKPERVATELRYLRDLGGSDNVCGVEAALLTNGHAIIVLPFFEHDKFTDYMYKLNIDDIRDYIRNLLLALARIHAKGVIHRDVKPSNFLYNHSLKKYLLVDFGLAQDEKDYAVLKKHAHLVSNSRKAIMPSSKSSALKDSTTNILNAGNGLKNKNIFTNNTNTTVLRSAAIPDTKQVVGVPENKTFVIKKRTSEDNLLKGCKKIKNLNGQAISVVPGMDSSVFHTPVTPSNLQTPEKESKTAKDANNDFKTPTKPVPKTPVKNKSPVLINQLLPTRKSARLATLTPTKSPSAAAPVVKTPVKASAEPPGKLTVIPETPLKTVNTKDNPRAKMAAKRLITYDETPKSRLQDTTATLYCDCFQKPQVCKICCRKNDLFAPRAGTPGFRAPEVLLKTMEQSTAVDVWCAGVVLIALLSGRYPFFRNTDDMTSLSEIISLLGTKRVFRAAKKLGKSLSIDTIDRPACDLRTVCETLREQCEGDALVNVPDSAYDLLDRLLDPYPLKRITAEEALRHPFLSLSSMTPVKTSFSLNYPSSQSSQELH